MLEKFEEESWSLDINLAKHILPRLLYLKNWVDIYSHPSEVADCAEWNEILEELTWTFVYIAEGYPSIASKYIKDVVFLDEKKESDLDLDLVTSSINITYRDEDLYNKGRMQDCINMNRCQQGLKLFAQYYMNLWN